MEDNDKQLKNPSSRSLFSSQTKDGKVSFSVNIPKLMFFLSGMMLILVYTNITLACLTNFNCRIFIPSFIYLGCFRGHDRLFIVACTYYALVLPLLYVGAYFHFRSVATETFKLGFKAFGFISAVSLPVIGLTDEVNAVHSIPWEPINKFFCMIFLISNVAWSLLAYLSLRKMSPTLNSSEKKWYYALNAMMGLLAFLGVFYLLQWKYAYSVSAGLLFNENIQALCEWAILTLGILAPTVFSQFFRGFILSFNVSSQSLEMTQV